MSAKHLLGRKVVVIDDDVNQAAPLAHLLRLEGIAATHEWVATVALVNLTIDPPDAVIVDVKMPALSGPDLVATLRLRNRHLPAVFLTSCQEDDPQVQCALAAGRVAYLPKPVDLDRLLDTLSQLIAQSS